MNKIIRDGDDFQHNGRTFRLEMQHDSDSGAPWDREDGHGPVSDWRRSYHGDRPSKAPGEMPLIRDGRAVRFYDFAEATRIAKRDGWGLSDADKAKLAKRLGCIPTARRVTREAVLQDFKRLRDWCNDEWSYVGVIIHLLDDDGDDSGDSESVWGVESDCEDYITETAFELADQLASNAEDIVLRIAACADSEG